jgi:enoyl-[acyl-carrier protein] reductase III
MNVEQIVIDTLVELTRYPREILGPEAQFDEDLGIDSLKRVEIFTALLNRFGDAPDDIKEFGPLPLTVGELVRFAVNYVEGSTATNGGRATNGGAIPSQSPERATAKPDRAGGDPAAATAQSPDGARLPPGAAATDSAGGHRHNGGATLPSRSETERTVVDVVAEITRYPREILTAEAQFDEDLGVDSLKRVEIVTALLRRFGEVPSDLNELGPMPLTVGELVNFAVDYVARSNGSRPAASNGGSAVQVDRPAPASADVLLRSGNGTDPAPLPPATRDRTIVAGVARPFEGKVALITGSGHGLGKVIARQMADLGAHVIINSFHSRERGEETTREILDAQGNATHLWGSFANRQHIDKIFDEIEQRFERLDYYVHNASDGAITSLDKVTEAHWEKAFRTNIVGYHISAMRAAKLMHKTGGGRIVALSSPGAQRYLEYFGVLGPVKAAVESFTMYLARELGTYNVQVNAVSAGPVYGERLTSYPDSDRLIPYWESLTPDGRLGDPEEISEAVLFLLTHPARKINGTTVLVDGAASQRM